jgi:WD40 repeat protein
VWAMGAGASWACERTIVGHDGGFCSMATWRDKVLAGVRDGTVCVWDVKLGTCAHDASDATLAGHEGLVMGLAVHGDRLFSALFDGTIREWALGTWAAVRTVEAYGRGMIQAPCCLAVSGSKLISGSAARDGPVADEAQQQYEVRVWDLGTMECEQTLPQAAGAELCCLAAGCGVVWGGVEAEVVVWGRA